MQPFTQTGNHGAGSVQVAAAMANPPLGAGAQGAPTITPWLRGHKAEQRTAPAVPTRPQAHAKPTGATRGAA